MTLLVAALVACAAAPAGRFDAAERAEYARLDLERARELRGEGDLVKAERVLRSVLAVDPSNERAQVMRADLLEQMGRDGEAARARATLAAIQPLPQVPLDVRSQGLVVLIASSRFEGGEGAFLAAVTDPFATQLAQRVGVRLPDAHVTRLVPGSVAEARSLLSERQPRAVVALQARRAFCGNSRKDGRFAVAALEVTVAQPGEAEAKRIPVQQTLYDLDPAHCEQEIAARSLELALARPEVRAALEASPSDGPGSWSSPVLRALFPGLDAAIEARVSDARRQMEHGRFDAGLAALRDAVRMDPDDQDLRVQLHEAERTVALSRDLRASGASFAGEVAREAEAEHARRGESAPLEGEFVHTDGTSSSAAEPAPVGSGPPSAPDSDPGKGLE